MKIQIKADEKSNEIHIGEGSYSRTFKRSEQPFEVKDEEWAILSRTKLFEPATEKKLPPSGQQQQQQQQSSSN